MGTHFFSKKHREKLRKAKASYYRNGGKPSYGMLGKHHSEETKKKIIDKQKGKRRLYNAGEKSHLWKGGISSNIEYRNWQKNLWSKRKREAEGNHSFGQWEELKAKYNWTCPACLIREPDIKLTEDHIIPLSKGGSNNIENIQPLCRQCNFKKHTKTIKY